MPATIPSGARVLSVGDFTRAIKNLLEGSFREVWVEGEVSNVSRPESGHVYLTLKDQEAALRIVLYRSVAVRLRFDIRDGMRVIIRGRASVYAKRGEYNLLAEELHPKGIGPLELAFRQLREKLALEGLFDPARKKPLPQLPRRIGLVTSPSGSAVRDLIEALAKRWPAAEVLLCPVQVQGDGAAAEVADALRTLNALKAAYPVDVVIVARGGGSLEDLWAFNEEAVARAISASRIPVVTGIGHEDDVTIADLVADWRALTPTDAANCATPDRQSLLDRVEGLAQRLAATLSRASRASRERLDQLQGRLRRGGLAAVERARRRLEGTAGRLEALSPLAVLSRGYSITLAGGKVARDASTLRPGQRLTTRLAQGSVTSIVESIP
jgi:exodeoxyribonuclease VII large subunit